MSQRAAAVATTTIPLDQLMSLIERLDFGVSIPPGGLGLAPTSLELLRFPDSWEKVPSINGVIATLKFSTPERDGWVIEARGEWPNYVIKLAESLAWHFCTKVSICGADPKEKPHWEFDFTTRRVKV